MPIEQVIMEQARNTQFSFQNSIQYSHDMFYMIERESLYRKPYIFQQNVSKKQSG